MFPCSAVKSEGIAAERRTHRRVFVMHIPTQRHRVVHLAERGTIGTGTALASTICTLPV